MRLSHRWLVPLVIVVTLLTAAVFAYLPRHSVSALSPGASEELKHVPGDWFFRQRAYPSGKIDRQPLLRTRQARRTRIKTIRSANYWQPAGPTNIPGRITDLAMHPDRPNHLYAAAASGGIWHSTDLGHSWTALFDREITLSIGDIAIAPSNPDILYVGTGEANAGGGSLAYDGVGIYRSTDAGQTWINTGLPNVGSIGRIAVHPEKANVAYVAAMGTLFANNPDRGLYKTTDGGQSWSNILFQSDSTGAIDVVLHPGNPEIVYATTWERVRRPHRRSYGGPSSRLYRSEDGGQTWVDLTDNFPFFSINRGRMGLAVSPADPDQLALYYVRRDGYLGGIYRSYDQGQTWESLSTEGINGVSFMWWFGRVALHPDDPDRLYAFGLDMYEWNDTTDRWDVIFPGVHVDQHALVFDPQQPDRYIAGNDGGIYVSEDAGATWRHCANLPITQFYAATIAPNDPNQIYGGTQDNGVMRTPRGETNGWEGIRGGDGFRTLIDPGNARTIYTSTQYGNFVKSTDGGESFFRVRSGIDSRDRTNWFTPFAMDPSNSQVLYYGTYRVYRTTNAAQHWTAISPDLTRGNRSGNIAYGTITDINVSPLNSRLVYAGTDDGKVWRTDPGQLNTTTETWVDLSVGLPNRWVTTVLASPIQEDEVFVTLSGFRFGERIGHIYHSTDRGTTWTAIDQGLPDVPVNDLVITENNQWYAATDAGVYVFDEQAKSWTTFHAGMPAVVVTDLDYHAPDQKLIAATYGRSIYQADLRQATSIVSTTKRKGDLSIFPNPSPGYITLQWKTTAPLSGELRCLDLQGRVLRKRIYQPVHDGQSLSWDLGDLPTGTYLVQWVQEGEIIATERLMIR